MQKPELLLPAGNEECLRAAVNNGADAVYLGLSKFNARQFAGNFDEKNIFSVIQYCHKNNVKVYITFNTLVKNNEINDFFEAMQTAYQAKADAVIIQDECFIPWIKKNFPRLKVHLSTQATITNELSVPDEIDRVILARELSLDEIKEISKKHDTEVFVHGALCFSYSGQCLFSSVAGQRSGNRGVCAQPCRKIYNNKYCLSTMDLCLLEKLPELINAGVKSLKVEGRMRSPLYVQTVARIYRKAIDSFYEGNFSISEQDIDDLKLAFNREFTTGFAFNKSVTDSRKPMNRGLFIGVFKEGKLLLRKPLQVGDGIGVWKEDKVSGYQITKMKVNGEYSTKANTGDTVELETFENDCPVFKTSSANLELNLGKSILPIAVNFEKNKLELPKFSEKKNEDAPRIFAMCRNYKSAADAEGAKADIIYYDIMADDCEAVRHLIRNSKFFVFTPRILSDSQLNEVAEKIKNINPDGVLVANKGLLKLLQDTEIHLDYSFNIFNDIDLRHYTATPIISPELNFDEISQLKDKRFIYLVHGDIILMTTKEPLSCPELIDEEGRHFRVRENHGAKEILNFKQMGLFNKVLELKKAGIKYFLIDTTKDIGKFVKIYRKILAEEHFNDTKIRKGYTTGHFSRGV